MFNMEIGRNNIIIYLYKTIFEYNLSSMTEINKTSKICKIIDGYNTIEYEKSNIYIIEDVLDNRFCEDFIHLIKTVPLKKITYETGNNVECYISMVHDLINTNDELYYKFSTDTIEYNLLIDKLKTKLPVSTNKLNGITNNKIVNYKDQINEKMIILEKIVSQINNKIKLDCNSGYILRKIYGPTRNHTDGFSEVYDSNVTFIKNNNSSEYRMIRNSSIIFALNDDYDGGIFRFPYHNISFKLKKGSVLLFPPFWTHPHEVDTPENNTFRYTINTWSCEKL